MPKKLGFLSVAKILQRCQMGGYLSSTLGFTVEMPLVETGATNDLLGEDLEDQNRRREGNGSNGQYNFLVTLGISQMLIKMLKMVVVVLLIRLIRQIELEWQLLKILLTKWSLVILHQLSDGL
jgi:hypothetical protein